MPLITPATSCSFFKVQSGDLDRALALALFLWHTGPLASSELSLPALPRHAAGPAQCASNSKPMPEKTHSSGRAPVHARSIVSSSSLASTSSVKFLR